MVKVAVDNNCLGLVLPFLVYAGVHQAVKVKVMERGRGIYNAYLVANNFRLENALNRDPWGVHRYYAAIRALPRWAGKAPELHTEIYLSPSFPVFVFRGPGGPVDPIHESRLSDSVRSSR